jgi:hypothetical protein
VSAGACSRDIAAAADRQPRRRDRRRRADAGDGACVEPAADRQMVATSVEAIREPAAARCRRLTLSG